jgi:hypothetical protein
LRYVGRFSDLKPDVVIVMHAFNDVFQASEGKLTNGEFKEDYGHFFGPLGLRVNPRDRFTENLRRGLANNWLLRTWYSDLYHQSETTLKKPVDLLRALPSFRRNLTQLVYRAKQDGVTVILATEPFLYHDKMSGDEIRSLFYDYYYRDYAKVPTIREQEQAMRAFNAVIREIACQEQVILVDLEASLPKSPEFMYDDVHYTVEGARVVARIFLESVSWDELLPKPGF